MKKSIFYLDTGQVNYYYNEVVFKQVCRRELVKMELENLNDNQGDEEKTDEIYAIEELKHLPAK